ncbi:MAG: hypothetical protein ACXVBH_08245 [Flavisolibacter sp.]
MKTSIITLTNCILLILSLCLLSTCAKEYSYEGGNQSAPIGNTPPTPPDTASFALSGDPGECTIALKAGDFIAGNSNTTNSVTISVNVTKTGPYSISTDTLDQIYFAASGRFTRTGTQNVTLKGYGTPKEALNLRFTPSTGFSNCNFNLSVLPPGPPATYVIESGFGSPNPCTYQVNGNYIKGSSLSSTNTVRISVTSITLGSFAIATETVNGMRFYYSGTFITTGSQYVILQGSGTPLLPGTYSFSPTIVGPAPLGGQACAFTITVQ